MSVALTAFISPFQSDQEKVRSIFPHGDFLEIYCRCPLEVCEARDVKGLYRKARAGDVNNFTGISSPYEAPSSPELIVDTDTLRCSTIFGEDMAMLEEWLVSQETAPAS
jgi:adenylylsulfate kinase